MCHTCVVLEERENSRTEQVDRLTHCSSGPTHYSIPYLQTTFTHTHRDCFYPCTPSPNIKKTLYPKGFLWHITARVCSINVQFAMLDHQKYICCMWISCKAAAKHDFTSGIHWETQTQGAALQWVWSCTKLCLWMSPLTAYGSFKCYANVIYFKWHLMGLWPVFMSFKVRV